jgi:hypothetical protein
VEHIAVGSAARLLDKQGVKFRLELNHLIRTRLFVQRCCIGNFAGGLDVKVRVLTQWVLDEPFSKKSEVVESHALNNLFSIVAKM